jgi:hypothetical protein
MTKPKIKYKLKYIIIVFIKALHVYQGSGKKKKKKNNHCSNDKTPILKDALLPFMSSE